MYRLGVFLDNIAIALAVASLLGSGLVWYFNGSVANTPIFEQQIIAACGISFVITWVLGWALKHAAVATPPKDSK